MFPKVVLIRGVWWSSDYLLNLGINYNPAYNISILGQTWTATFRSNTELQIEKLNVTIKYFSQPVLTNSILLWYDHQYVNFMPNIFGYNGNYWAVNNRSGPPFELEMYGCEDYDLEKGKSQLIALSIVSCLKQALLFYCICHTGVLF
jgi:hypothetical protein